MTTRPGRAAPARGATHRPGPRDSRPRPRAVQWLTALQAQDCPGVLTSVALRSTCAPGRPSSRALGRRRWSGPGRSPARHLVLAESLPWCSDSPRDGCWPRHRAPGRARPRPGHPRAGRGAGRGSWPAATNVASRRPARGAGATPDSSSPAGAALPSSGTWRVAGRCFGRSRPAPLIVSVDRSIPAHHRFARKRSASVALRSPPPWSRHGPAFTGGQPGRGQRGPGSPSPGRALATVEVDGVEHTWSTRGPRAARRRPARAVGLPPTGFDQVGPRLSGRGAVLPDQFADRIVQGDAGVQDRRSSRSVLGTWTRPATARSGPWRRPVPVASAGHQGGPVYADLRGRRACRTSGAVAPAGPDQALS